MLCKFMHKLYDLMSALPRTEMLVRDTMVVAQYNRETLEINPEANPFKLNQKFSTPHQPLSSPKYT